MAFLNLEYYTSIPEIFKMYLKIYKRYKLRDYDAAISDFLIKFNKLLVSSMKSSKSIKKQSIFI